MEDDEDVAKIGKKEKKTHKYLGKIMLRKNLQNNQENNAYLFNGHNLSIDE